jgi:sulfide:quinone oxidoreductase
MAHHDSSSDKFDVLIVGGGVASLEAALALHAIGADQIATTILAPNPDFVYRPTVVGEPFDYAAAGRYPLGKIADDIGAELRCDSFKWLEPDRGVVHTAAGDRLSYDALLLAPGARLYPRFRHALTVDDAYLDEALHGLVQDLEGGYLHSVAFLAPSGRVWPLPIYELALMSAARAYDMDVEVSITIVTPEDSPLAIFGSQASAGVHRLLEKNGIRTINSAHSEVHRPGRVSLGPGRQELEVDRIVALPELVGRGLQGVPSGAQHGFIPVDVRGQVVGRDRVYAAGDATDFPVKHGGIASQQADFAAQAIAALAGLSPAPAPFHPQIHGILLTGGKPVYLSAQISGEHSSNSQISETPTWSPATKIAAKYLAPYLQQLDEVAATR